MAEEPRGYLTMTVIESSGLNKDDKPVWDAEEGFEGFVKVELRGGSRNIKVATRRAPVQGNIIVWNEPLVLEVLEHANELRVMLCRDKYTEQPDGTSKRGTQVLAACGIYVSDILDAVPIDKYFELFRPGAGGEGGFIRLGLDFGTEPPAIANGDALANGGSKPEAKRKRQGWLKPLLLLAAAAAAGAVVGKRVLDKAQEQQQQQRRQEQQGKKQQAAAVPKLW